MQEAIFAIFKKSTWGGRPIDYNQNGTPVKQNFILFVYLNQKPNFMQQQNQFWNRNVDRQNAFTSNPNYKPLHKRTLISKSTKRSNVEAPHNDRTYHHILTQNISYEPIYDLHAFSNNQQISGRVDPTSYVIFQAKANFKETAEINAPT